MTRLTTDTSLVRTRTRQEQSIGHEPCVRVLTNEVNPLLSVCHARAIRVLPDRTLSFHESDVLTRTPRIDQDVSSLSHVSHLTSRFLSNQIDGAGLAKLETLESAITLVQRLNTIVERMAQAQRMQQPLAQFRQQIQRAAAPVASLLKPQFEPIASMVTNLVLVSTRGGTDQAKVRSLRESVAQIRAQLEASQSRVRQQHAVVVEAKGPEPEPS
jgi:hypothetical protein